MGELRRMPITIDTQAAWGYEEKNGLSVFVDWSKSNNFKSSYIGTIPLRTIRAYMRRIGEPKKRSASAKKKKMTG